MVLRCLWSFTGHTDFDVKLVKPVCFAILTVCSYSASLHFIQERKKNKVNCKLVNLFLDVIRIDILVGLIISLKQ